MKTKIKKNTSLKGRNVIQSSSNFDCLITDCTTILLYIRKTFTYITIVREQYSVQKSEEYKRKLL